MKRLNFSLIVGLFLIIFTACSGNSEKAMPMTQENMSEYIQNIAQASKTVDISNSIFEKAIQIYKNPLDNMGYDFDSTLISMTKLFANEQLTNFTQITYNMARIHSQLLLVISKNPDLLVSKGFIDEQTKRKLLLYLHFKEMKPETIQALKYVQQCQNSNNGICTISRYVDILISNNFVKPTNNLDKKRFQNLSSSNIFKKENYIPLTMFSMTFDRQVNSQIFEKYIVYQDGKKVNANGFIEYCKKPFKLKNGTIEELNNYDPWWVN